jgi:hypothetical protein
MARSTWRRRLRKLFPMALVAGFMAVPVAWLVSAVREARRAANASVVL